MANSTAELSKEVINFQYAVMFGVIGSVTFAFDKGPPAGVVFTAKEHWIEFTIFVIYFVLDWWTANVRSFDEIRSLPGLFVRVIWIGFLGATIIFLNSHGAPKYLLLFTYTFITGIFDVVTTVRERVPDEVLELLAAVPRLLVACVFFVPAFAGMMGRTGVLSLWDESLAVLAGTYVCLKIARTEFWKLNQN